MDPLLEDLAAEVLVEAAAASREVKKMAEHERKCPDCKVVMLKLQNNKGVVIDKCPRCEGIFLDKGELVSIRKLGFFHYVSNYFRRD